MDFIGGVYKEECSNVELALRGLNKFRQNLNSHLNFFVSDNLITFGKNLSFLGDLHFMQTLHRHAADSIEMGIIWRSYILCYFANIAKSLPGDFVEVGCYKGTSAHIIADKINLASSDKLYYLYDAFEHTGTELNHAMPEHGSELFKKVETRFAKYPFIKVIKGYVPDSFDQGFPEKIAFAHVDMNQAPAEVAALERIVPILSPGGFIILDDYGWQGYKEQKAAEDPFLASFGLSVLELPTGQGLVIKPYNKTSC